MQEQRSLVIGLVIGCVKHMGRFLWGCLLGRYPQTGSWFATMHARLRWPYPCWSPAD